MTADASSHTSISVECQIGITQTLEEIRISLFIQPRASQNRFMGWHDGRLKVALTAPPVDGAANKAVCEFLSKSFKVPKTSISIVSGETSRQKTVSILCDFSKQAEIIHQILPKKTG